MTDNEIIKAFEKCALSDCDNDICQKTGFCCVYLYQKVLGLIERQRAEIEALKKTNPLFEYAAKSVHRYIEDGKVYYVDFVHEEYEAEAINEKIDYLCHIQDIRTEAIKEFERRLKAIGTKEGAYDYVSVFEIDNLVKEMVGADNG